MIDEFIIVKQHPRIVEYVDSLQRTNAEALSFYPRCVFERESALGRIFLGILNGEPCGYIYAGSGSRGDMKCHQVCVPVDARRRLYGAALAVALEDYALSVSAYTVTLRCGFDLQANDFWKSLGYACVRVVDGGVRRMRKINVWMKQVQPELFGIVGMEPAVGKTSAAVWAKHKKTGIVTQFVRGAALQAYRASVLEGVKAHAE